MKKDIEILCKTPDVSGIKIIIDQIRSSFTNTRVKIIRSARKTEPNTLVIPYGINSSFNYAYVNNKSCCKISLMIDAVSLGSSSCFFFYLFDFKIPFTYKVKLLLQTIKFFLEEYYVFIKYDKIVLVSEFDRQYFENIRLFRRYISKILVVPNGVFIPASFIKQDNHKNCVRLGILNHWNSSLYHFEWFIHKIWYRAIRVQPNLLLCVAGKGIDANLVRYFSSIPNVEIIGEVDSLEIFFNNIDISLVTQPKKCGVLNKVLDSFAYKVPVLGLKQNFLAFKNMPNCYYTYSDVDTFLESICDCVNNKDTTIAKVNLAYDYIQKNSNWNKNYVALCQLIKKYVE